jgi:RHS repeat-associated protein
MPASHLPGNINEVCSPCRPISGANRFIPHETASIAHDHGTNHHDAHSDEHGPNASQNQQHPREPRRVNAQLSPSAQLDRLTQASPDNALQSKGLPSESYGYDPVGNRTSSAHQAGAWLYNQDNQLTQYPKTTPFSTAAALDTQVSYTPQGHTQEETNSLGTKRYGYNAAERLIQVEQSDTGLKASYRYDPFGRRIAKTVTEGASTATTYFIYNGLGFMAEANESGQLIKAYGFNPVAGLRGLWGTDPIWRAKVQGGNLTDASTQNHFLHTDHLGTPMLSTDRDGKSSWKAVSEAFGASGTLPESTIAMNLRFPGQYWDEESKTHYNFKRDYRPNTGRYIENDPIGIFGGVNLYIYPDNPTAYIDPLGLLKCSYNFDWQFVKGKWTDSSRGFVQSKGIDVSARCENNPDCSDKWRLSEGEIRFNYLVKIPAKNNEIYSRDSCSYEGSIKAEGEHVTDLTETFNQYRTVAEAVEENQKRIPFSTKKECEAAAKSALKNVAEKIAYIAFLNSQIKWDLGDGTNLKIHRCDNPRYR